MYRSANAVHPVLCLVLCFLCFLCVLVCSSDECAFLLVLVTLITFTLLLPLLKASCQSSSFPDIANLRKNRHQDKITRNQVTFFKLGTKLSGEGEGNTTYLSPFPPPKACFLFSHCRWCDITLQNIFIQISSYSRTYVRFNNLRKDKWEINPKPLLKKNNHNNKLKRFIKVSFLYLLIYLAVQSRVPTCNGNHKCSVSWPFRQL